MEPDDPMARVRERQRRALVDELLPKVRRLNPTMPDDQVLELAGSLADSLEALVNRRCAVLSHCLIPMENSDLRYPETGYRIPP